MDQKARAAPMTEMLNRLTSFTASGLVEFKVVYFGNETLLNQPVEEWPLCEALIAFYSTGFPLQKAQEYVALRPNPSPSPSPSPSLSPSPNQVRGAP
jgi:inositol hexakisphosphate/diphosphoinositol-pentakisphosphate kinase